MGVSNSDPDEQGPGVIPWTVRSREIPVSSASFQAVPRRPLTKLMTITISATTSSR